MVEWTTTRRRFLRSGAALGLAGVGSVAGCIESRSPFAPPVVQNRPDAVYIPSHFEGMKPIGTASSGPLSAALTYSYPHRFWLVSGTDRQRVRIKPEDTIHLMVQVWDRESGTPIAGATPQVTVEGSDGLVADRLFWPMLSQQMGFHYGDNIQLDGEGTYSITLSVPPTADLALGRFKDVLADHHRFEFTLEWDEGLLEDIPINMVEDGRKGTTGALTPMMMGAAPLGRVRDALPGRTLGTAPAGEMQLAASVTGSNGDGPMFVVTAATPYNDFAIPMMGPAATLGETTVRLQSALDPEIGMHYRGRLPGSVGDGTVTLEFSTPPQVARHEGYEMAFMQPEPVEFSLE